MNLEWNVYIHDINKQAITTMNIFDHSWFKEDVERNLKEIKDKNEFAAKLRSDLIYYFWCRSEYEIVISPWCGSSGEYIKIDIFDQVMNNWEVFLDYVWNSKKGD